ncbi:hypothetical protein HPB50_022082 [Hyalomma asiaticum]|uniref:Uncharacterized protein n=1 Tax=Hyalomma asiaticum TaxID=266040 RepID=A0ACB7TLG5_HYAAI|nr:hypothetical protein HPB50_022082 [Hyalomma asiaticum]
MREIFALPSESAVADLRWTPLESVTYCGWTWPTEASWDAERGECVFASSGRKLYYLLVTVALFFLPVAIMLTAYSLIVWRLWITQMPGERSAANINAQCRAKKKGPDHIPVKVVRFSRRSEEVIRSSDRKSTEPMCCTSNAVVRLYSRG